MCERVSLQDIPFHLLWKLVYGVRVSGCVQWVIVIIASRIWEQTLLSVQYFNWKSKNWPIFRNVTSL